MTKKDYELIASVIVKMQESTIEGMEEGLFGEDATEKIISGIGLTAAGLGIAFTQANPRFQFAKFMQACTLPTE